MQVVILCGGQGTRAYPYTATMPKAMMTVADAPIVEQVMRIYASQGFDEFILSVGYLKEHIEEYVQERNLPWKVTCADTGADTDTGGRIVQLKHLLHGTFHATYCDGLGDIDLRELVDFHRSHGRLATVTTCPLRSQYGIVLHEDDCRVTGFHEKPVLSEYWINGGFFVFEPEVFDSWQGTNLERDVLPHLSQAEELYMHKHRGFWRSMDTYKDQQELNQVWQPYAEKLGLGALGALGNQAVSRVEA